MNSNADYTGKEIENIRRSQETLENSFVEKRTELRAVKTRMNNAEECISDVEGRIMDITQSGWDRKTNEKKKQHESNIRENIILRDEIILSRSIYT